MARIIKGTGGQPFPAPGGKPSAGMTGYGSRIIDGETFNARVLARELVQKAEEEKQARVLRALSETDKVETESYEVALKAVHEECLRELLSVFEKYEQFYLTGQNETIELSREIVRKVLGEEFQIPQNTYDSALLHHNLPMKKLTIEMPLGEANELARSDLPLWLQIKESTKPSPGRICVYTEGFEIECSKEAGMTALRLSNDNG